MRVFVHPQYCSLKGAPQSVMAGAFSEYVLVEDVVAMYKNGITVEPNDIMLSEAQIKGSCAYLHEDIYEVIDNLKKGVGCMTYILFI